VTAAGRQIATSGAMTAVRCRVVVLAVRTAATATTASQRVTGRVASAAGMEPQMTAASVLTTGALHVIGDPPVIGDRDRILPLIGRPAGAVRMARRRDLPVVGPGTARRGATLAVTGLRRRPVAVTATAGRNARPLGGRGPDRGREAAPGAR
jgi:hypothetical protein